MCLCNVPHFAFQEYFYISGVKAKIAIYNENVMILIAIEHMIHLIQRACSF